MTDTDTDLTLSATLANGMRIEGQRADVGEPWSIKTFRADGTPHMLYGQAEPMPPAVLIRWAETHIEPDKGIIIRDTIS